MTLDTPVHEHTRRWPDFQGGRPILLPDNQVWQFYEPSPKIRKGRAGWTFGADVAPDVDQVLSDRFSRVLYKWKHARDDADRAAVVLTAAWFLLARNYNVTDREFQAILAKGVAPTLGAEFRRLIDEACDRAVATLQGVA